MNSMKKWIGPVMILCCVAFGSTPAAAYVTEGPCVDTDNSNLKVSGFLSSSEIDYDAESPGGDQDSEAERKIIGLTVTKRINPEVDIYGSFGYLFDGTGDDHIDLDSGTFLSAGLRYMIHQSGNLSYHLFGQLDYIIDEQYSESEDRIDYDFELEGFELSLGAAVRYQKDDRFSAFAGIMFVPVSDLSYDYKRTGNIHVDWDGDIERDDEFGLKFGANYLIDSQWSIGAEADFISEKAFLVSVGRKF